MTNSYWLGPIEYSEGLLIQKDYHHHIISHNNADTILGCEHFTTITLGKRGLETDIKTDLKNLDKSGVKLFKIDRGGKATLHNLGQLVIYPIVSLKRCGLGVKNFLQILEFTTIDCLNYFDIDSFSISNQTGIFTRDGKIASFGIRISKGVSLHGLSINVNNHLSDFDLITPCGDPKIKMSSFMSNKKFDLTESVFKKWVEIYNFNIQSLYTKIDNCSFMRTS